MREPVRMSLLENSYDFLNEALRCYERSNDNPEAMKFAILHLVQAIELLLKARLQAEHRALIYENVDRGGRTVSLELAVTRLGKTTPVRMTPKEKRAIRKAQEWRDAIVHHEFELPAHQTPSVYTQLFEFVSSFHNDHTDFGEIHQHIEPELWDVEAALIQLFKNGFVIYNGVEVPSWWPADVMRWQSEILLDLHGQEYQALPYGTEPGWEVNADVAPCHDCGVVAGMFHMDGCDVEACPRCFGQLITCGCQWGEGPPGSEIKPLEVRVAEAREWAKRVEDASPRPIVRMSDADKARHRAAAKRRGVT